MIKQQTWSLNVYLHKMHTMHTETKKR